jgi:aspartate aminotransferase
MLVEFAKRREYVKNRIAKIEGVSCPDMAGAFYAFVDIKKLLGRKYGDKQINTCTDWCLALLEQQGVATVMGSAFGAPGYARLSFATDLKTLESAFDRIEAFLKI